MTKETLSGMKSKVHWFAIPLLASILGWLMISQYNVNGTLSKLVEQGDQRGQVQERMWNMVVDNNKMLISKADQQQNELDHGRIMVKLDKMDAELTKFTGKSRRYGSNFDTIIRKAEKIHTLEMTNLLESYFETVWNKENNKPGEQDSIISLINCKLKN